MEFPVQIDRLKWQLLETGVTYWMKFGYVEKKVGSKNLYQKITVPGEKEELLMEIAFFRSGILARIWYLGLDKNLQGLIIFRGESSSMYAQILKNGAWITGLKNEKLQGQSLTNEIGQFIGISLGLKVAPEKTETLNIYKDGRGA